MLDPTTVESLAEITRKLDEIPTARKLSEKFQSLEDKNTALNKRLNKMSKTIKELERDNSVLTESLKEIQKLSKKPSVRKTINNTLKKIPIPRIIWQRN